MLSSKSLALQDKSEICNGRCCGDGGVYDPAVILFAGHMEPNLLGWLADYFVWRSFEAHTRCSEMKASEAKALSCRGQEVSFLLLVRGMVRGYGSSDSWGALLFVSNVS